MRADDHPLRRLAANDKRIAGSTPNPGSFTAQVARNRTDAVDGFLLRQRRLLCDRSTSRAV